ncbi:TetR/AcrR family transcriptional regulator [Nocardia sp. NPDC055053]
MNTNPEQHQGRQARRLHTRQRVFDAAIAELMQTGVAEADINAIAESAGVARGTFYFHFPTKEHVLLELEQREESRIARALERFSRRSPDLRDTLVRTIRLVTELERQLGSLLFRDLLAMHFSPTRPVEDSWREHPLIIVLTEEIARAGARGEVQNAVEPHHSAMFFLLGLYGLLTATTGTKALRQSVLDSYLTTTLRSLEPR